MRRSLPAWLAAALVVGLGLALYVHFGALHVSGRAPPPRLATPSLGWLALWLALFGMIPLAADLRPRDERANIADSLDARPMSNLALLVARCVAVALPAWLSLAALGAAPHAAGLAARVLGWSSGQGPEPVALITFLALDAPPTLLLWAALALLLSAALRSRAAVVASLLALLAAAGFGLAHTPLHLLPALSGIAHLGLPGSEIMPRVPTARDFAQRFALLALAAGCLVAAAALLPRRDHFPRRWLAAGAAAPVLVGAAIVAALVAQAGAEAAGRRDWAAARSALRDAPRVDVERIAGRVDIDPGRTLALDLRLRVRVPDEAAGEPMRFSLNPGFAVSEVTVDGEPAEHGFALGLLTIAQTAASRAGERVVGIRANGRPDGRFGYPGTAVAALDESIAGLPLALLGEQATLFDEQFVALLPGAHWLPRADVAFGASWEDAPDFRAIDLRVRVPPGWTAAGAGRDTTTAELRFRPAVPLAEFALLAAPWPVERVAVGGVEVELLMHPKHAPQMPKARAFAGSLLDRAELRLRRLATEGLEYAITAPGAPPLFSIVETPAALRRYGGGGQMQIAQALPGVQLLAEHGFPTMRLDFDNLESTGEASVLLERSGEFGANRVPLANGVERNFLPFLTRAAGVGATKLNLLLDALAVRAFLGFRAEAFSAATLGAERSTPSRLLARLFGAVRIRPALPDAGGSGFNALVHGSDQLAAALDAAWSTRHGAKLPATLLVRHAGSTFTLEDFASVLAEQAPEFAPVARQWLAAGTLPAYVASPLLIYRLPDDESGRPRYQLRLHLRNDEPAGGFVRLVWRSEGMFLQRLGTTVPVPPDAAIELGVVLAAPPAEVQLDTFLSRNRGRLALHVPKAVSNRSQQPFVGHQPSRWRPATHGAVVVDDLDDAFSTRSVITPGLRFSRRVRTASGQQVPSRARAVQGWGRLEQPFFLAWGRYRRSLVNIRPGSGASEATFAATLPSAGRWRLAYHLPGPWLFAGGALGSGASGAGRTPRFGTFDVTIGVGDRRIPVPFDASAAASGWNALGTFDLPAGEVRVVVSDRTSGYLVVADAIRWRPANEAPASEPQRRDAAAASSDGRADDGRADVRGASSGVAL